MKETVLTSARETYESPSADIIEFAVERGFENSLVGDDPNYGPTSGIEGIGREEANLWY